MRPMSLSQYRSTIKIVGEKSTLFAHKKEIFDGLEMGLSHAQIHYFLTSQKGLKISRQALTAWLKKHKNSKPKAQILESTNALQAKADAIAALANGVKTLSLFQTLKWLVAGGAVATGLMYGFFEYREQVVTQKLQAEFDAKIQTFEARTSVFSKLKSDDWNALILDNQGVKQLQLVVRDSTGQANSGRGFATDPNGKKYQVSYFNIPIFK